MLCAFTSLSLSLSLYLSFSLSLSLSPSPSLSLPLSEAGLGGPLSHNTHRASPSPAHQTEKKRARRRSRRRCVQTASASTHTHPHTSKLTSSAVFRGVTQTRTGDRKKNARRCAFTHTLSILRTEEILSNLIKKQEMSTLHYSNNHNHCQYKLLFLFL